MHRAARSLNTVSAVQSNTSGGAADVGAVTGGQGGGEAHQHVGLLGVPAISVVRVLVAAESLGGGEAAAAVVALEPSSHGGGCGRGRGFFGLFVEDFDAEEANVLLLFSRERMRERKL